MTARMFLLALLLAVSCGWRAAQMEGCTVSLIAKGVDGKTAAEICKGFHSK